MITLIVFITSIVILYGLIGYRKIYDRYKMYLSKSYWTDYNTIEFFAWFTKAAIIIPGLGRGKEIGWLPFSL